VLLNLALALTAVAHAAPSGPARIAIDGVSTTPAGVALTWHAEVSGRYVVWIGGSYCGNGRKGAEGRYEAPGPRTVVLQSRRADPAASQIRICLRTPSATLSDAVPLPGERTPVRISIDGVEKRGGQWTLVWHAATSGRFVVWVRGTYCGGGAKAAEGSYEASPVRAARVKLGNSLVRPGVSVRVCLQTPHGLLSDAVPAGSGILLEPPSEDRWAFYSALAVATVAFAAAFLGPFLWKRRERVRRRPGQASRRRPRSRGA
jgi:hypothetical protein